MTKQQLKRFKGPLRASGFKAPSVARWNRALAWRLFMEELLKNANEPKVKFDDMLALFSSYDSDHQATLIKHFAKQACVSKISGGRMVAQDGLCHILRSRPEYAEAACDEIIVHVKSESFSCRSSSCQALRYVIKSCPHVAKQEWCKPLQDLIDYDIDREVEKQARGALQEIATATTSLDSRNALKPWAPSRALPEIPSSSLIRLYNL